MGKKFEVEIRARIDERLYNKLISDARQIKKYSYQDEYWKPKDSEWDPEFITMRLRKREGDPEVEILFSHVNYFERDGLRIKRSIYPEGKIKLFSGSEETAKRLLKDCGFEYWFSIKKLQCVVLQWNNVEFAVENVEGFGLSLELEGDGTEPEIAFVELLEKLKKMGIRKEQFMTTSLPKAVALARRLI